MIETPLSVGAVDECSQWSEWKNRDDPTGLGDTETIAGFEIDGLPDDLCLQPTAAQGRIESSHYAIAARTQNVLMGLNGLDCVNDKDYDECVDYEVRFCCPGNTY